MGAVLLAMPTRQIRRACPCLPTPPTLFSTPATRSPLRSASRSPSAYSILLSLSETSAFPGTHSIASCHPSMTSRSPSPSQPEDDAATPSSPTTSPAAEQNTDAPPDSALENGTLVVEDLDTPVGAAEPEVDLEEPARTSPVDEISPPLASQVDDKADEPTLEPSPQELTEESQLEGEDEPFTAVSLGGPTSRPTTPTHAPSGSHVGPTSPSSPSLSEAFSRRSRGDRTSFLISNATRQSENRQSFDGTSKLKEEFERLRSTHRRTSSHALEGQASGSSPRSSVHRGTSKGRRLSGQSRSSVQNGLAHGEEEAEGIAEEEDGELVDEPISPVDGQHEDVDWSFWGEVMNGSSARCCSMGRAWADHLCTSEQTISKSRAQTRPSSARLSKRASRTSSEDRSGN